MHICACFTTVVALCVAPQILSVPKSQLAVSEDAVRFLGHAEHEDGGRGGVTFQTVLSSRVYVCGSGRQCFLLLVCQDSYDDSEAFNIWSTTPVAVLVFVTRHRSRAVHEHERAHEDQFRS